MSMKKQPRTITIVQADDKLDRNDVAAILARYITGGDPVGYLKRISTAPAGSGPVVINT